MSSLSWDQLVMTCSAAYLLPFQISLRFLQALQPTPINVEKKHLSELFPTLSLSVWPIKKLGSTLTAFLSSCSLRLWQMHVIFLVLHFAFSLWIGTLFLYSTPHSRSRLLCATTIIINIRVAHTHSALVSMALGRRSFMMSFWKIILHLKDLVFRVFFRNP